jgi:hypothetical protein
MRYAAAWKAFPDHLNVLDWEEYSAFLRRIKVVARDRNRNVSNVVLREVYIDFVTDDANWHYIDREVRHQLEEDIKISEGHTKCVKEFQDLRASGKIFVNEHAQFYVPPDWVNEGVEVQFWKKRQRYQLAEEFAPRDLSILPHENSFGYVKKQKRSHGVFDGVDAYEAKSEFFRRERTDVEKEFLRNYGKIANNRLQLHLLP